jgi:hypothetical protein
MPKMVRRIMKGGRMVMTVERREDGVEDGRMRGRRETRIVMGLGHPGGCESCCWLAPPVVKSEDGKGDEKCEEEGEEVCS